ncbi:hypothetical protein ACHAW5_005471 [Stephanodiscus triporus]|uniref:Uncharacterized protein n=1 Tax=Stephanodiscus triporus TaxID=2934178 RepID=A0ABD3QFN3_9STRA
MQINKQKMNTQLVFCLPLPAVILQPSQLCVIRGLILIFGLRHAHCSYGRIHEGNIELLKSSWGIMPIRID